MVRRGKGKKGNRKRLVPQNPPLEPPSAYNIINASKYIPIHIPPITELLPSIEVSVVHDDIVI